MNNDSFLWDQIIKDAVKHRTLEHVYYQSGYRQAMRDMENQMAKKSKSKKRKGSWGISAAAATVPAPAGSAGGK